MGTQLDEIEATALLEISSPTVVAEPVITMEQVQLLNVFQYIYTLLLYMPGHKNGSEGMEQLMPWSSFIQKQCSGLIDVETVTVENHPTLIV